MALGLPRFVSAIAMLPAEPVVEALQSGRPVGEEGLARFAGRSATARQLSSSGRIATDLAAAKLAAAARLPTEVQSARRMLIEEACALLEEGLAATPSNTFAWAQLANARSLKDGPGSGALDAWRMSVLTGPAEPRLALWRARFGISHAAFLREGDHDLLVRQIRFAWRGDAERFADYARAAGPRAQGIVREALLDQPEDLERFESAIR